MSKDFHEFCCVLGIHLNLSSRYCHSANQAERAVCTVKDLMKCCCSASAHWRLSLVEYLCTPGPSGKSPSELLCRQFRDIMPMLSDSTNCISDTNKLADRREEEKGKFDAKHQHDSKPLIIGSTVSFLNSDLKMWSVGKIHGRSDRNRIHLWETNVVFRECVPISIPITDPGTSKAESVMAPKSSPVSSNPPATNPSVKTIKSTVGSNDNLDRTRSGRVVKKPTRYRE